MTSEIHGEKVPQGLLDMKTASGPGSLEPQPAWESMWRQYHSWPGLFFSLSTLLLASIGNRVLG